MFDEHGGTSALPASASPRRCRRSTRACVDAGLHRRDTGAQPAGVVRDRHEFATASSTGSPASTPSRRSAWRRSAPRRSGSCTARAPAADLHGARLAVEPARAGRAREPARCCRRLNPSPRSARRDPRALPDDVLRRPSPLVLRGLVAHWPLVQAARESQAAASTYLLRFYRDATRGRHVRPAEFGGRFFYNDDLSGFNFRLARKRLDARARRARAHSGDATRRRSTSARRRSTPRCRVFAPRTTSISARAIRSPASGSATARASPRIRTCPTTSPAWPRAIAASRCSRPSSWPTCTSGRST